MPVVRISDDAGDTMTLLDINERFFPVLRTPGYDQETEIRGMESWEARCNDVLVCAYPKSGTHWVWEIVNMLINQKATRIPSMKESAMLEGSSRNIMQSMSSPRILNTHLLFCDIPRDFVEKKCKIIHILRNPKDVAVSFYNHHVRLLDYEYSGTWRSYLPRFLSGRVDYGSWFDNVLHWHEATKSLPNGSIHVMTYENLHTSTEEEIKRLAEFLGVGCNNKLSREICEMCSFSVMKQDKDPLEDASEWKHGEPGMYRRGQVGDWRNWFTVAQNEMFTAVYEQKMADSDVTLEYGHDNV